MSQDIVRQSGRGNPTPDDLWGAQPQPGLASYQPHMGGGMGLPMVPPPAEPRPMEMIHRSLRGRYKYAVVLAAACAVTGAAIGWKLNQRTYRASGLIKISPLISTVTANELMPEYSRYMTSEASSIPSQDIAERALGKPAWTDVAGAKPQTLDTKIAFLKSLRASYNPSSYDITITYEDANPKVALAGVQAVLDAYTDVRVAAQSDKTNKPVDFFEGEKSRIEAEISAIKQQINVIQRDAQGNVDEQAIALSRELNVLKAQHDAAAMTLLRMNRTAEDAKKNPQPVNERVLAANDPFFARLVGTRDEIVLELTRLQQIHGRGSPVVIKMQSNLEALNQRIGQIGEAMSKEIYGTLTPIDTGGGGNPTPIIVTEATLAKQSRDVADLAEMVKAKREMVKEADNKRVSLDDLKDQIAVKQRKLADTEAKLALAQAKTITLNAPFRTQPGLAPIISEDKRATMATFGFFVGAGLPLAGFVLLGLLDRKYRYSDETNASSVTRGIPLLGILPNLPDRLSDPSQASVAAHCVHQIRTMLQLNAVRSDGPTVLSVTSATSGDGKTSLSLALGLSFAASGSRTLLIDTDLIGAGLSNRLGIREPRGISEAIVARNPMEFVRDTDVADLAILPVGTGGPQNASAFSPNAVRRLLGEMRKHFDLILIDTGPVLGSIEATPVVASSDGVILTASRGQNRDLVEKAITQLRNAGARVVGFVFNRANAKDFERSISGISLRSVSRAQAAPGAVNGHSVNGQYQDDRLGPLVHSVRGTRDEN